MAGGRPLKFESVEELQSKIDEYFEITPKEEWAITGLAVHLDTSRVTLMDYQERPEFFNAIKRGKDKVEQAYELRGIKRGNAFDIFGLKNFGWTDKTESEVYGKGGGAIEQSLKVEFINGKRPDTGDFPGTV